MTDTGKTPAGGSAVPNHLTLAELERSVRVPADQQVTSRAVAEGPDDFLRWEQLSRELRLAGGA